jgi:hypothetical protein
LLYKIKKRVRGLCKLISLINGSSISPSTPPVHLTTAEANESKLGTFTYMLLASPTPPPLKVVELVVRRQLGVQHHDGDDIPFVAGEVSSTRAACGEASSTITTESS